MSTTLIKLTAFIFLSLFIISTSYSVSCTKNSKSKDCLIETTTATNSEVELDTQQVTFCYGLNSSNPFVCSGNGNCTSGGNCTCTNGFLGLQCQYKPAVLDLSVQIVMISFASLSAAGTIIGLSIAIIAIVIYLIQDCLNARKDIVLEQKLNKMNRELKKGYNQV